MTSSIQIMVTLFPKWYPMARPPREPKKSSCRHSKLPESSSNQLPLTNYVILQYLTNIPFSDQPTSPLESPPDSAGNASSACLPVTPTITSSRDETELLVGNLATERVPLLETETATNLTAKPPLEAGTRMELSVLRPAVLDPSCDYEITC